MTEKRFKHHMGLICEKKDGEYYSFTVKEVCDLLNAQHEENQELKQSNEDARRILKKEFDFATEQRQKHLDDPVVANAYDIIRYDMRRALDKLGGYDD